MVTREEIENIAGLSRLKFSEQELQEFSDSFGKIVGYFDQLSAVNTDDVEPLKTVMEYGNVFREDVVQPALPTKQALSNAPKHNEVFFKVPKVIE
jgi:aspartyl-tRNA(Asn)/glutamyl-tRNA(Gln) amidotransferase subunit C